MTAQNAAYLWAMEPTRILFNARCPICRAEIAHYERRANSCAAPLLFEPIENATLERWDLTEDAATRRLHALLPDGKRVSGISAFAAIWAELPGFRWAARVIAWPIIGPLARFGYDHIAAPLLYRLHLRRERLGKGKPTP